MLEESIPSRFCAELVSGFNIIAIKHTSGGVAANIVNKIVDSTPNAGVFPGQIVGSHLDTNISDQMLLEFNCGLLLAFDPTR